MTSVLVYADADAVAETTGARLLLAAGDLIARQGRADIGLTGGTVGIDLLRRAAASPLAETVNWTSVHVWWGDERFVPTGHEDRNEGQAQAALLGSLPLPEENIHRMGSTDDFASVEEAAQAYASELTGVTLDVLMLGLGPDGHVASLFPGHPGVSDESAVAIPVHDSPKPPPTRVSLSLGFINSAREVWVIAAGAPKARVVARCLAGDWTLPGSQVRGTDATLWVLDAAAATRI